MSELEIQSLAADSPWALLQRADSTDLKYTAAQYAISEWYRAKTGNPIPQLYRDLPMAEDGSGSVDSILTGLILSDDIEAATDVETERKLAGIVNNPVTVHRIAWRESDVEGEGWGAYVLLEISGADMDRGVYSTSAKQVVTVLWRCFCEERFPVRGIFRLLGTKKVGRDQPIGFQVESAF